MQSFDRSLFISFAGLTLFGLVMMSSMSISGSFEATGENDFYFWRHFWYIVTGIPLFLVALKFPYEKLKQLSVPFFTVSFLLLILTLVMGQTYGTFARLWLKIGSFSFQPVEVMKIAVVVFLAALFSSGKSRIESFHGGFLPFSFILGIPALLLVIQSDFGSLLILTMTAVTIYFVGGASLKHLLGGMGLASVSAGIIVFSNEYILHRVKVFLNPELDPLNTGFQVKQALIAIGSGGIWGRGFQNSIQKFDYLPEVQSDTIFAAISEEMGFFRILLMVGIYLFIAFRGFYIAQNSPNQFAKLLTVGLTVLIVGQAFMNIFVNLALLPNTGITLPLISYGGTSLWASFVAFGMLLHLSGQVKLSGKRFYG